ncbi:5'-phosphate synthase pdxT subunit [Kytococcus aerolatus]|uniref:Pyridoxal 5'-phosphate synthase subunit PdxT n=1 Tax=Kytococcus aerolatus TaxID=592308 RepID=A0A212T2R4_9MICO|nr:pyridoxal 5'-phosphate synthase glutaminase subunit PdxT [Kytococcus aerolatus]SNC60337.1 5'-phosphate synthase pdxT subunit [Kytococcus aerolatus]
MTTLRVGVLALQGDVREHTAALQACGVDAPAVRTEEDLAGVDGLVLPGGESTVIDRLARLEGLSGPLRERIAHGLPVYGSCAGMILLADRLLDGHREQQTFGGIDMTVRRNAFGRQVDSFETELRLSFLPDGAAPVTAVFIRAPWVEQVAPEVELLARVPASSVERDLGTREAAGRIVAVRQGNLLATSFHPEITGDRRVHEHFVEMVRDAAR